ncbi:glyoxalase superfamily protein [Pontivivens nitratireducens]|uniref:glyoxalase superfamily protein n=1 Tax=Pontivivens nitratireducens TaxID=2758038 RepID=UPI003D323777
MRPPVPVLRSFDTGRARDFWIGYLGVEIAWEHRFAPDLPLYMARTAVRKNGRFRVRNLPF